MSETKATRAAYGEALVKLGHENDKIVVLDADLANATMTMTFAKEFPNRHFDVGIAEANMVDMAAGMSRMGLIPFCSTFAVFAGRSYDQIRNGVCYPHFNVKLAFTHAGVSVGEDGGSHQAIEDIALMRVLPGMTVICPCDANETYQAVKAAAEIKGPVYLRLARLATPVMDPMPFTVGKGNVLVDGSDAVIFTCGLMVSECLKAAELLKEKGMHPAIVNLHTIKPIDAELVRTYAAKCKRVYTVEEHSVIGGLGDAVADVLLSSGVGMYFQKDRRAGPLWSVRQGHGSSGRIRPDWSADRADHRGLTCQKGGGTLCSAAFFDRAEADSGKRLRRSCRMPERRAAPLWGPSAA